MDLRKPVWGMMIAIGLGVFGDAQQGPAKRDSAQSFDVGGRPISIPAPVSDMADLRSEKRRVMEAAVPPGSRLVAAFVVPEEMSSGRFPLSRYALVMVPANSENVDFSVEDFKAVTKLARTGFDATVKSSIGKAEGYLKDRNLSVKLGEPVPLGRFFDKEDALGHGTIIGMTIAGRTATMADGSALVRARKRLLIVHLYVEYKNDDTVAYLRRTSEDWVDRILTVNR